PPPTSARPTSPTTCRCSPPTERLPADVPAAQSAHLDRRRRRRGCPCRLRPHFGAVFDRRAARPGPSARTPRRPEGDAPGTRPGRALEPGGRDLLGELV